MRTLVIGTAGHIDHGKSALVRALTGTDPDRLKEERERGITIDLGFAHLTIGDLNVAFVDVPGHERFVKNMLAGVGGIDAVMLVVAADESVMPQTREHFDICRLLHVPAGLVVLTKSDLVDPDTIELVRLEVRDLVAGSFLESAPVLAVSARTGDGLEDLRRAFADLARAIPPRAESGAVRLPIDRVFSIRGFGTVITGTLVSGVVHQDEEVMILPGGRRVKVRGVQVHGEKRREVVAGNRAALNLGGVEVADVARGDTLVSGDAFRATRIVDVMLDVLPGAKPIRHGARIRFHYGTSELLGRVSIGGETRRAHGANEPDARRRFSEVPSGASGYARIRLEAPAVITRGDRFIVRSYSPPITIGGGLVLDPQPPRIGIRTPAAAGRFAALDPEQPDAAIGAVGSMIAEAGAAGLPRPALVSRAGLAPAEAAALVERLTASTRIHLVGDTLVAADAIAALESRLTDALSEHHRGDPLGDGLPREEARERIFARADPGVFEFVLARLSARGTIVARERLALSTHRLALSPEEARVKDTLERAFQQGGLKPPDLAELATAARVAPPVAERIAALLVRQKVLARVDTLLFHQDALTTLRADVAALKAQASGRAAELDVGMFKERYGVSRKYAIPLLEYLDRERVTRRVGDKRVIV